MSTVAALVAELTGLPQSRVSTDIVTMRQQVSQEITFLDGTVSMFSRLAARIQLKDALVAYLDGNVLYDNVSITSVRPGGRRRLHRCRLLDCRRFSFFHLLGMLHISLCLLNGFLGGRRIFQA